MAAFIHRREARRIVRELVVETGTTYAEVMRTAYTGGVVTKSGFLDVQAGSFRLRQNCGCVVDYVPNIGCHLCRGVGA